MKLFKKKTSFFVLMLAIFTLIVATGCSKKTEEKNLLIYLLQLV